VALEYVAPLVEAGDPDAPAGSRAWALHMVAKITGLLQDSDSSAWLLEHSVEALKRHEGWRQLRDARGHPFLTYEGFCFARPPFGLGYDPEAIERIWRERRSAQTKAQGASPVAEHGGARTKGQGSARSLKHGENDDYYLAVLARDHKDIFARLQAGEFESVVTAAREAGIKRHYPKVTPTPEGFARAARKHIPGQIAELVRLLSQEVA
jgi:hypothetical protein